MVGISVAPIQTPWPSVQAWPVWTEASRQNMVPTLNARWCGDGSHLSVPRWRMPLRLLTALRHTDDATDRRLLRCTQGGPVKGTAQETQESSGAWGDDGRRCVAGVQ